LTELYEELFRHDGYGELQLEIRFLRRGQKEVIIRCGKQYRYVVPYREPSSRESGHRHDERRKNAGDRRQNAARYPGAERRQAGRRAEDRIEAVSGERRQTK